MRRLKGTIISDKMDKTIVVEVTRLKQHKKYEHRFKLRKHYKVHDPENKYKGKTGEVVRIEETRPMSKDKNWKVI